MTPKRQREDSTKEKKEPKSFLRKGTAPRLMDAEEPEAKGSNASASDSDLSDEDEFDVGQVAELESSSEDNEDDAENYKSADENQDEAFPLKKKKKNANDGKGTFANAFNAIIGSRLKAHDRKDPILIRSKSTLKKLESDKLEGKAKRAMLSDKRELQDKLRVTNLLPSASDTENAREIIEKEKRLKKVAQKGVVKLFNAVLATQVRTNHDVSQENVGQNRKDELLNELTKLKFLDLVKAAGDV